MKPEKSHKTTELPAAPTHLSADSQALWQKVVELMGTHQGYSKTTVTVPSPGRLALLTTALEARDRAAQARSQIEKDGLVNKTETTGTVHAHPLLKVEKDSMALFQRCWSSLRLDWHPRVDGGSSFG